MAKGKGKEKKGKRLTVNGPWGTKFSMPVGKLPIKIGSDSGLSSSSAVYPRKISLSIPLLGISAGVVAGNIAVAIQLNNALVSNWATRFASLFDEYSIVGARFEIRPQAVSALATGYILASIDEKSVAIPTISIVDNPHVEMLMSNTESPSKYHINWIARDYLDLQWTAASVSYTPMTLKIFGGAATGIGAANTAMLQITGCVEICFRGYV